jgi:hypothetical protein
MRTLTTKPNPMATTTKAQQGDLDLTAAPAWHRARWVTLISAGLLLGAVAGCTAAVPPSPTPSGPNASARSVQPSPASGGQSTAAAAAHQEGCSPRMLLALNHHFGTTQIRIERCRNGYAHVFSPPSDGEQYFLRYLDDSWHSVSEGTGLSCSDPDISRAVFRACTTARTSRSSWLRSGRVRRRGRLGRRGRGRSARR